MNLKEHTERICSLLENSSYGEEAESIQDMYYKVEHLETNHAERISALENLISRCYPRWLGDYYIAGLSYQEWTNLIASFKKKLLKEIKRSRN